MWRLTQWRYGSLEIREMHRRGRTDDDGEEGGYDDDDDDEAFSLTASLKFHHWR